jgi:hypothetical protein
METYPDPQAALAMAERAGAAPYVDYPPTPKWYPFVVGAWMAALILAGHGTESRPAVFVPVLLVLVAAEGLFIAWYRRYYQTWPSMRRAPKEINAAYRRYAAGLAVAVAVCAGVWFLAGPYACAAIAFVVTVIGLWAYERAYAHAAAATRERLATP